MSKLMYSALLSVTLDLHFTNSKIPTYTYSLMMFFLTNSFRLVILGL